MKAILREGLLVLGLGMVLALVANFLSPRGLSLSRDYFHQGDRPPGPVLTNGHTTASGSNVPPVSPFEQAAAGLKAKGLQVIDANEVMQTFRDPRRQQELVVFIDARNDQLYQEGHVPGAHLFDHYRAENYFPAVLPVCQNAMKIVIYCNGGHCEDSEFAAITLRDAGVPKERIFVYPGGMAEWLTNGMPVETGARNSGILRETKK
jgi:rhodanese-related sulfurtransferase